MGAISWARLLFDQTLLKLLVKKKSQNSFLFQFNYYLGLNFREACYSASPGMPSSFSKPSFLLILYETPFKI